MEDAAMAEVHSRIRREIEPLLGARVLDIGSGGVPDFESNETRTVLSMDYELDSLFHAKSTNVINVAGDMLRIPLRAGAVDAVIAQQVVHYLTDAPFTGAGAAVRRALAEAGRVLAPGGSVFIVDSTFPVLLVLAERALFGITYPLLRKLGRPTVFFPSVRRMRRLLAEAGFEPALVRIIDWGDMAGASQTLFPALRFPLRRLPVKLAVISARKADAP
jgi:SAM-dependent methyltransferase